MRIGLFTDTYPPFINGVSTSVSILKKALEKEGHKVYIVTVQNEGLHLTYDPKERILRIPGIPIGIYDYRLSEVYSIRSTRIIKKWKLDVIHSHTEFGIGTYSRLIAKQFKIPLVHTYHTMYEDYVHYLTRGLFNNAGKKLIEYLTLFYCDKTVTELVVPTKKACELFKSKYKVKRDVHIVPTGIDVEKFYIENNDIKEIDRIKDEYGVSSKNFNMLFVGRLAAEKNVEYLIDVVADIMKKNKNVKFFIIGDGPDYNKYEKKINKLKLQDNIILVGKVPFDKIGAYYQMGDVFLTASTSETQGLTVVEAMAAGVPPICIDDESFRNVVEDNINGRIFKTKKELKNQLLELMGDKQKLKILKDKAKKDSVLYSSKYYGKSILEVYNSAINNYKKHNGLFSRIFKINND